ncbi:GNAT family N-acetyltransferase [Enterococcus casseliflavus]|uniref:GNAT family N-acetyltransferase n=1 Tax=Enterococcus casseliflavus TaxID=37734 RepID=UPI0039A7206D
MLTGNKVTLTPAEIKDKEAVYQWCFHSETTKYHSGPPSYPNVLIATEAEFFEDYQEYYFTGAQPQNGRGFLILHAGEPIGFISYSSFHLKDGIAELDIWLNREIHCGKGFGTDAIVTLGDHLHETLGIQKLMMRPSRKNIAAVKSYEKAGFTQSSQDLADYLLEEYLTLYAEGDYGAEETVTLIKTFPSTALS